ncbi:MULTISPECIES: DMT family transporter [unclassified Parvimonas]|uniref:DMT family transporter n=1 Tax=unclassified Parvimonas TaxID=1151464 RepID=UPI002B49A369|nr:MULTISPECIES: DMT family transporter [unclassified Parvimonas]MEB3024565.1 DMT family transporter [Parvimonas sp. M13]MEB3088605.1 DMT family transporter [Parvimonas sp. M20]
MKKFKNEFIGLSSGFLWAVNGIVFSLLMGSELIKNYNVEIIFFLPLVFAGFNDLFAGLLVLGYNGFLGKLKMILPALKTKTGKWVCFAGLIGGPVGQCSYIMGISLAGPAYAIPISALCPMFGTILSFIFLKEKINLKTIVCIIGCIIGTFVLSYTKPTGNYPYFYLGILFSLLAGFSWGLEATIVSFATKEELEEEIILNIREIISGISILFLVLPCLNLFGSFITTIQSIAIIKYLLFAGFFASLSYLLYYKGMNLNGVSKGMALNSTFSLWSVVLSVIFLSTPLTVTLLIGVAIVTISVIGLSFSE